MLANWIKESISSIDGGTGELTLGGAVTNFAKFDTQYLDGQLCHYTIEEGSKREVGIGTLTIGATDKLARTTVLETLDGATYDNTSPTKLTFTTAAEVYVSADANNIVSTPSGWNVNTVGVASAHIGGAGSLSQAHIDADYAYAIPFLLSTKMTVTKISVDMDAAVGTKFRVGIYTVNEDGKPGVLLSSSGDETPAEAVIDCTITPSLVLNPGWYYTAVICDGAATWQLISRGEAHPAPSGYSTSSLPIPEWKVSAASWSALPDPFGTPTAEIGKNLLVMRLL